MCCKRIQVSSKRFFYHPAYGNGNGSLAVVVITYDTEFLRDKSKEALLPA